MDFFPEDLFETSINLNASEYLNSRKLDKWIHRLKMMKNINHLRFHL